MTAELLGHRYPGVEMIFIDRLLTRAMNDMERVTPRKLLRLAAVVVRIVWARVAHGAGVLYYSPSGASRRPVVRDVLILGATRWMFRRTILHFHASGLGELYPSLSRPLRWCFRHALFGPDVAIRISENCPDDARVVAAHHVVSVSNGVPDLAVGTHAAARRAAEGVPRVLFVGTLRESKGIEVLIGAAGLLAAEGVAFRLCLMGDFISDDFASRCRQAIERAAISDRVDLLGVLEGEAKVDEFARASVFCTATYFEAESSPVVIIEAMQFTLPVVATRWRGIPDLVADGESGLLVPTRDVAALAGALRDILADPALRLRLGAAGRARYEAHHSPAIFHEGMARVFDLVRAP